MKEIQKQQTYIDLERAVLGALMMDPDQFYIVGEFIRPDVFTDFRQEVAEAIWEIRGKGNIYDFTTLQDTFEARYKGEPAPIDDYKELYFSYLDNPVHDLKDVGERLVRRFHIREGEKILMDAQMSIQEDGLALTVEKINEAKHELLSWSEQIDKGSEDYLDVIAELNGEKPSGGILTYMGKYNAQVGGITEGDLVILAGRPGMGKTFQMLQHILYAVQQGEPCAIFSLEETKKKLIKKLACLRAGFHINRLNRLEKSERLLVAQSVEWLHEQPLYIFDLQKTTGKVEDICTTVQILQKKVGLSLFAVDYIQLCKTYERKWQNRERELSIIAAALGIVTKATGVPAIVLSQLSRANETRGGDRKPQMSDLRGSGAIEQVATAIWFPYRPEYYGIREDHEGNSVVGLTEIIIGKCRADGSLKEVSFYLKVDEMTGAMWEVDPKADNLPGADLPPIPISEHPEFTPVQKMPTADPGDDIPF